MKFFLALSLLSIFFIPHSFLFAEEFMPATKHYSIEVPEDWEVRDNGSEEYSVVYIVNPAGNNGMKIMTSASIINEEEESIEDYLKRRVEHMADKVAAQEKGKVHGIKDVEIDGISAKHIDFQMKTLSGLQQGSQTVLIHNGLQYMMTYGSSDKKEKKRMDKIAASLRLKHSSSEAN